MKGCAVYSVKVPASDGISSESLCICYKIYLLPYVYGESGLGVGWVSVCTVVCVGTLLHCINLILFVTILFV